MTEHGRGGSTTPRGSPALVSLLRLLQLASPALPVGAFSYSQGLERAVEDGIVRDESSAARWIEDALVLNVASCEGRFLLRMLDAWIELDTVRHDALNAEFLASRETAELRAETVQMGHSLACLLTGFQAMHPVLTHLRAIEAPSYPCAWAAGAHAFGIGRTEGLAAYLWSWAENQALSAVKLVPLGQSAGQRLLLQLGATIAALAEDAPMVAAEWTNFAPGLALASCRHEQQYSRLFRS